MSRLSHTAGQLVAMEFSLWLWRVAWVLVEIIGCDNAIKEMYDPYLGRRRVCILTKVKYNYFYKLTFSERLAQTLSISEHLVIMQHEK